MTECAWCRLIVRVRVLEVDERLNVAESGMLSSHIVLFAIAVGLTERQALALALEESRRAALAVKHSMQVCDCV